MGILAGHDEHPTGRHGENHCNDDRHVGRILLLVSVRVKRGAYGDNLIQSLYQIVKEQM